MAHPISTADWTRLLALSAMWSTTFFLVAIAQRDLPPLTLVLLRTAIAALALNLVLIATRKFPRLDARMAGRFLVMGLLNNLLPFALIFWAQTHIASGLAAILNATTPLFAMLLAHVLTRDDRIGAGRVLGIVTGIAGVATMVGLEALAGWSDSLLAQLAVLGAAFCYGCASIYGRRFRDQPPSATAAGQLGASALLALPIALIADRPWTLPLPGGTTIAAVLALALIGTALGYVLYFRILRSAGAVNLMLVTLLMPAGAVLLGTILLGEQLAPRQLAGMALIAMGLVVIDGRLPGRLGSVRVGRMRLRRRLG